MPIKWYILSRIKSRSLKLAFPRGWGRSRLLQVSEGDFMKIKALLLTAIVGATFAQQTKPVTATSTFYDVDGQNDRAFVEFSRNSAQKLFQAILKEDPAIRTASLSVRLYGGNPAPPGRYRLVVIREGFALPNTDLLATLVPKAVGMSYDDYMKKSTALRKVTGQTLRRRVASTSGDRPVNIAADDILRIDLMKISPDRASDYYSMEQNDWLPMHAQRVKEGILKSWSVWAVVSPSGSHREADAVTTAVYKNFESAMSNPQYAAMYSKLFPDRNSAALFDRTRTVRTIERSDLWRVVWAVNRQ
jgi:hypothetical protein